MKRQLTYSRIVRWMLSVIFLLSLCSGCAHKKDEGGADQFFKQWKMTAKKTHHQTPTARFDRSGS